MSGAGLVRSTDPHTLSCGKAWPRLPENRLDHTPAATTTAWQAIVPFSVTTPDTLPAALSTVRTAHSVSTVPPSRSNALATAGAALSGSARPSEGV